jgi:predicted metal-dependent phosphoesterase TrpH
MSLTDTVSAIHAAGGLAALAHPLLPAASCVSLRQWRRLMHQGSPQLDAVETFNCVAAGTWLQPRLVSRLAKHWHLPAIGGSDAHSPTSIGAAYTVFSAPDGVDVEQALRAAISHNLSSAAGRSEPFLVNLRAMPARLLSAWRRRAG